eukprot:6049364-Prymnesium_polylepis.3
MGVALDLQMFYATHMSQAHVHVAHTATAAELYIACSHHRGGNETRAASLPLSCHRSNASSSSSVVSSL